MKIKFIIVYILAGVLFAGASLWVFLSKGKSAKALRYKYKMGGIMLTAWSLLSAASMTGCSPVVTCYEPMPPEVMCYDPVMPMDEFKVSVKGYEGTRLKPGDVLVINITAPSSTKYVCRIYADTASAPLLQTAEFSAPDTQNGELVFEMQLADTDYKGYASVSLSVIDIFPNGEEKENELPARAVITII